MLKLIIQTAILAVLLFILTSCGSSSTSTSLGTLDVNGPGITGSVPAGTTRLYTLHNIVAGRNYTVRTTIATYGSGTTAPDGTLTVSIYTSEAAFKSDPTNSVAVLTPDTNYPYVYESYLTNLTSSGDYIAAISGKAQTVSDTQFFYDLRVMSAAPPYLLSFVTTSVTTTMQASSPTVATNLDYMHIYSGGTLTLSGPYPVNLRVVSAITVTTAYPQLFVYGDPSLSIGSLLYSSVTDSMNFNITTFNPGTAPTTTVYPTNTLASGVTISSVPFTSPTPSSSGSPFIVVRGTSAVSYVLTVGPAP